MQSAPSFVIAKAAQAGLLPDEIAPCSVYSQYIHRPSSISNDVYYHNSIDLSFICTFNH